MFADGDLVAGVASGDGDRGVATSDGAAAGAREGERGLGGLDGVASGLYGKGRIHFAISESDGGRGGLAKQKPVGREAAGAKQK